MGSKRGLWARVKMQRYLLLMLAPAFILVILFNYAPLFGWVMAFTDYKVGQPLFSGKFTGLLQFRRIFLDSSDIGYLLRNTLVINVSSVVLNLTVAVVFALLVKEIVWKAGMKIVQTVSFFPYFISWVISYSVMAALLSVNSGVVNRLLVGAGALTRGINFLGSPDYSWQLMILLNMWKFTGYNTIIFLSTISGIPTELYESAGIDGASRFQKVVYITLPHVLPTAYIMLILNSGWIFSSNLEQFFIFTNSTNWEKMEVLDMYIYKFGMKLLDYPYSTAVGILKSMVSLIMLAAVNGVVKKLSDTRVF